MKRLLLSAVSLASACACSAKDLASRFEDGGIRISPEPQGPSAPRLGEFAFVGDLKLEDYESCDAIVADVRAQLEADHERLYKNSKEDQGAVFPETLPQSAPVADTGAPAASTAKSQPAPDAKSSTNVQVQGVDEADYAKVGTHHIFNLVGTGVVVLDRQTLGAIGDPIAAQSDARLFVDNDKLVILDTLTSRGSSSQRLRIFALLQGQAPTLLKEQLSSGSFEDARLVDGQLVIVSRDFLKNAVLAYPHYTVPQTPVEVVDGKVAGVECTRISKPLTTRVDSTLVKVTQLNLRSGTFEQQTRAMFGSNTKVYMTNNSLYLFGTAYEFEEAIEQDNKAPTNKMASFMPQYKESTILTKMALSADPNKSGFVAVGKVQGRVKDEWAFQEFAKEGVLTVATSTGQLWSQDGATRAQNHLWVLGSHDGAFELKNAVNDFGTNEDIRAVRYFNDIAYIVTFKKTDPLYAIDLSNPLKPKMLGELKIPGFSVYMHPTAPGRLLGVGFDANDQGDFALYAGLKVSLFDISNPRELKELDKKIIGTRGSYSDVTGDHHAFYFDAARQVVGLPMVELQGQSDVWSYGSQRAFSGAAFFKLSNDKIEELARVTHIENIPAACRGELSMGRWWQGGKERSLDISRLFEVDGKLVALSQYAATAYALAGEFLGSTNPSTEVKFADPKGCVSRYPAPMPVAD